MKFVQVVEFKTMRIDEFNKSLDDWMAKTQGSRTPTRGQQTRDRDRQSTCAQIVECPSHEAAMENSNKPETSEFAASLAKLCDGFPVFRNLDVLRTEEM